MLDCGGSTTIYTLYKLHSWQTTTYVEVKIYSFLLIWHMEVNAIAKLFTTFSVDLKLVSLLNSKIFFILFG